jgi:hypothetical protein
MPRVRFVRGVVWNKEPRGAGEEHELSEREARIVCDGYKDAVRIDSESPAPTGMTVRDSMVERVPRMTTRGK